MRKLSVTWVVVACLAASGCSDDGGASFAEADAESAGDLSVDLSAPDGLDGDEGDSNEPSDVSSEADYGYYDYDFGYYDWDYGYYDYDFGHYDFDFDFDWWDGDLDTDSDRDPDSDAEVDAGSDLDARDLGDGCRSDTDCASLSEFCLPPGAFPGCGIPSDEPACVSTPACVSSHGTGYVCGPPRPEDCFSEHETICRPGCTLDACDDGETCAPNGLCEATECDSSAACPTHFDCADGGDESGHCARRTCEADRDCDGGWCVLGDCYAAAGTCSLPVP